MINWNDKSVKFGLQLEFRLRRNSARFQVEMFLIKMLKSDPEKIWSWPKFLVLIHCSCAKLRWKTLFLSTSPLEGWKTLPSMYLLQKFCAKLLRYKRRLLSIIIHYAFWTMLWQLINNNVSSRYTLFILDTFIFNLVPSSNILHRFGSDGTNYRLFTMASK